MNFVSVRFCMILTVTFYSTEQFHEKPRACCVCVFYVVFFLLPAMMGEEETEGRSVSVQAIEKNDALLRFTECVTNIICRNLPDPKIKEKRKKKQ